MTRKEKPAYAIAEAARYIRVAPATLRSWVMGRTYSRSVDTAFFRPLIHLPVPEEPYLSFENMIEAHVLWGLRNKHNVPLRHLRTAIDYSQSALRIDRLLLNQDLCTSAGEVFLKKYGQLLNLSRSGQIAIEKLLRAHLRRVEWDVQRLPRRLYPFTGNAVFDEKRLIVIDPAVQFGRPVVENSGISTAILVERIDNGEEISLVAEDYGISAEDIEAAILFENVA